LKPTGKGKLSKRDGDKLGFPVFPLVWEDPNTGDISAGYREDGYIPQAVLNMLALLGWNEGDGSEKEIYTLEELVKAFSLDHVSKGGSKFDPEKTNWFQHHYLQGEDNVVLAEKYMFILKEKGHEPALTYVEEVVKTIKERATFVSDFWELSSFYFQAPSDFDAKAAKKAWKEETPEVMQHVKSIIAEVKDFSEENLQNTVKGWITNQGIGFGKVMQPLRLALVGEMKGPDLFHIMASIGKEQTLQRLDFAVEQLG